MLPQMPCCTKAEPEALFVKSVLHFNSFGAGPAGQDQATEVASSWETPAFFEQCRAFLAPRSSQVVFPTLARANHSCLPN